MKTYTEAQIKELELKVFAADTNSGQIQVKAYLKENAVKRMQSSNSGITEDGVRQIMAFNSHQSPVDEIVRVDSYNENDKWIDVYEIHVTNN